MEGRDDVLVSDLAVAEIILALARRLRQGSLAREVARRRHSSPGTRGLGAGGIAGVVRGTRTSVVYFLGGCGFDEEKENQRRPFGQPYVRRRTRSESATGFCRVGDRAARGSRARGVGPGLTTELLSNP